MKFGRVADLSDIDFLLPADHPANEQLLRKSGRLPEICIGLPTWNRQLLKGFYPRGIKDELSYYATQFNSIEFNASFYNFWDSEQIQSWVERTPKKFKIFPKVHRLISHERWLKNFHHPVDQFTESMRLFGGKLGSCFLQLHEEFGPENIQQLRSFVEYWPTDISLAIEFRDAAWFSSPAIADEIAAMFEAKDICNVIIDTPGRRDLLHMRLTSPRVMVRFLGCGEAADYERLKVWAERLDEWQKAGLEEVAFFLHHEPESVTIDLARYFAGELSQRLGTDLVGAGLPSGQQQLF